MKRDGQPTSPAGTASTAPAAAASAAVDYATAVGLAILAVDLHVAPSGVVVLGHGAGGDIDAPDLLAVRAAALEVGLAVVRVRQPYRVAGRRAPAPAAQLDVAFSAVLAGLRAGDVAGLPAGLPLVVGGRSSGARVAARTSAGAAGVLALAFPLVPPGKTVTRADELRAAIPPVLVLQGARDPFGSAAQVRDAVGGAVEGSVDAGTVEVVEVPDADHSFRTRKADPTTSRDALATVRTVSGAWLATLLTRSPEMIVGAGNRRDRAGRSTPRR